MWIIADIRWIENHWSHFTKFYITYRWVEVAND